MTTTPLLSPPSRAAVGAFRCNHSSPAHTHTCTHTHRLPTSRQRQHLFLTLVQEGWCGHWDCWKAGSKYQGTSKSELADKVEGWWWRAVDTTLLVWSYPKSPNSPFSSIFWLCQISNSENTTLWSIRDLWSTRHEDARSLQPEWLPHNKMHI